MLIKILIRLFLLILFYSITSCEIKTKNIKNYTDTTDIEVIDSNNTNGMADLRDLDTDCIRGEAKPLLISELKENSTFQQKNRIEAVETCLLPNGDSIKILNTGCEYFVLKVEILTKDDFEVNMDTKKAYSNLVDKISYISQYIDAPVDFAGCINFLRRYTETTPTVIFNEGLNYGAEEIQSIFIFESVEKINNKVLYKFSMNIGPL